MCIGRLLWFNNIVEEINGKLRFGAELRVRCADWRTLTGIAERIPHVFEAKQMTQTIPFCLVIVNGKLRKNLWKHEEDRIHQSQAEKGFNHKEELVIQIDVGGFDKVSLLVVKFRNHGRSKVYHKGTFRLGGVFRAETEHG